MMFKYNHYLTLDCIYILVNKKHANLKIYEILINHRHV